MQWHFFLLFFCLMHCKLTTSFPLNSVDTEKQLGMTLLQAFLFPTPPSTFMSVLKAYSAAGNHTSRGGGVLRISSDRDDHIKIPKIPRASNKTPKNPWTKIQPHPPQKKTKKLYTRYIYISRVKFLRHKISRGTRQLGYEGTITNLLGKFQTQKNPSIIPVF